MSWKEAAEMSKQFVQKELYNENNQPFDSCSDCKNKLEGDYKIFKSYSRLTKNEKHKLIFGIALCSQCLEAYASEISKSTTSKLEALRETYPDFGVTSIDISFLWGMDDNQVHRCAISNKTINELNEYQISAICYNDKQITPISILGDEGLKEYQDCISDETQGYIDDFVNRVIDLPPEIEVLLKDDHLVLI
ncbi:hypothetical protein [Psychroserpens sp. MEBiC05023]